MSLQSSSLEFSSEPVMAKNWKTFSGAPQPGEFEGTLWGKSGVKPSF